MLCRGWEQTAAANLFDKHRFNGSGMNETTMFSLRRYTRRTRSIATLNFAMDAVFKPLHDYVVD